MTLRRDWREWLRFGFVVLVVAAAVSDCRCGLCDRDGLVEKTETLSPSSTEFQLKSGPADKDCHAKFTLFVSWKNIERSKDPNAKSPFADSSDMWYDFRASLGSFVLAPLPPRKDSTFPRDYYWAWEMDAGAKNEPTNPTVFEIRCWCNGLSRLVPPPDKPDWWDILVYGKIEYSKYDPGTF